MSKLSTLQPMAEAVCGLLFPNHYLEWEELVFNHRRLLIQSSRDHGKTHFFSILYPLYCIAVDKSVKDICIISYSATQSTDIITKIKDLVESRPLLQCLKPKDKDKAWSKTELQFANGKRIVSKSFGSAIRGLHCDVVICDDPTKDYAGMPPEHQWEFFKSVIMPVVKPKGQMIVVGTPVYFGDLIERLEKNKVYHAAKYPAISDGKALWPEYWPLERLMQKKAEMSDAWSFAREYLLERIDPATAIFRKEWIRYYDQAPDRLYKLMSVDPAISAKGDYTGITVTGTDEKNLTYVLEAVNLRTDNVQQIVDEIFRMAINWQVQFAIVESIGFQRLFGHWIYEEMRKRNVWFGIEEIKGHSRTKEARIMGLQPRIQGGALLFHESQDELVKQLLAFPKSAHDDLADALCMQIPYWSLPEEVHEKLPERSFDWWVGKIEEKSPRNYFGYLFDELFHNNRDDSKVIKLKE